MTVAIDVVHVERIRRIIARYPRATHAFFTDGERSYCNGRADPALHFAGTFAAKEAVVKALRLSSINAWARRIEIVRETNGNPVAFVEPARREVQISISHDAGVAVAVAVCD